MSAIQAMFQQAQLAEAAYADFSIPGVSTKDALIAVKFSPAQADAFVSTWQFVDQYTAPSFRDLGLDGTGFSATIFKNIDSSSPNFGKYTLAIRGSTDLNDFIEDAGIIAADGVAIRQLVDLYNFWQRATTSAGTYRAAQVVPYFSPATPTDAIQVGSSPYGIIFRDSSALPDASLRQATGTIPVGLAALDVVGHSLGGHLAMAFTRLFPGIASTAQSVNGLGFKIGTGAVNDLFSILDGAPGFDPTRIENAYGIAGPEFAAMDNGILQQPGGWRGVFINQRGQSHLTF